MRCFLKIVCRRSLSGFGQVPIELIFDFMRSFPFLAKTDCHESPFFRKDSLVYSCPNHSDTRAVSIVWSIGLDALQLVTKWTCAQFSSSAFTLFRLDRHDKPVVFSVLFTP